MKQTKPATVEENQQQADGDRASTILSKSKRQNAMLNKFHFLFHLRTDGIKDKGFPFIYAKVVLNGNRVNLGSTGIRVRKEDWDYRSRRSKRRDVQTQTGNELLDAIEAQVRSIYLLFESERRLLTPNELKRRFQPNYHTQNYFVKAIEKYLEESKLMSEKRHITESTHATRLNKLNLFVSFLDEENKRNLTVDEIKSTILERYKKWVLLRGCKLSYAQKCQQFVKTVVLWSCRNGYSENNPLANFPVHVDKTPILEHLTEEELKSLINTKFPQRLQETVDCYLFACHTGLAYIDMKTLTKQSIVVEGGRNYISGKRTKTDTGFFVPISTVAQKLIDRYGGIDRLPLRSNKEVNMMLKVAMAQIGIDRRIWFHTARKTFAMRMQNKYLMSDETTAAMIGHKSTKELRYYRSITKERVLKEAANLDF